MEFQRYPEWNPFIREISGDPIEDDRIRVFIAPPGSNGMRFRPSVMKYEKNREFRWIGHLLYPGLFDGEHCFIIEAIDENRVRFIHMEIFRGILVPILWGSINTETRSGFRAMNDALKERAESIG